MRERVARRRTFKGDARARVARAQLTHIGTLTRQVNELERELHTLIQAHRPALLAQQGCGTLTAATLIGRTAGSERFPSDAHFARQAGVAPIPASSGQVNRDRLHRGGDRQLNRALHMIAMTQFIDADDERVVWLYRIIGTGKGSGVPVDQRLAVVWTIRDRLIWRGQSYLDHQQALEAVARGLGDVG